MFEILYDVSLEDGILQVCSSRRNENAQFARFIRAIHRGSEREKCVSSETEFCIRFFSRETVESAQLFRTIRISHPHPPVQNIHIILYTVGRHELWKFYFTFRLRVGQRLHTGAARAAVPV